ncbi:MAG TPA: efflux RND transporter periplasmic adaptor subunit [Steroidobacteraceae bacterium]|nr:efflux RND transporter periplasmic adaptor subunit [Steroidobacteraceae bacterium]
MSIAARMARLACAAGLMVALSGCGEPAPAIERASPAPLDSIVVELQRTPVERQLDGKIEAVNQGTVAAQTSGRVTEILYDVNDFVPAGAVILRLRATEQRAGLLQAQAALREATARETEANQRFERVETMYRDKLVPKAALDEATASRDAARAQLAAARAALQSAQEGVAYTEIRAPYAGVVTRRNVEVGETVAPGTPLMSGLSLQFLRVAVDVPQSIVDQVRRIRKAAVYVDGRRVEASKLTIFPEAAATTSTFRARLELPENATDLYPGMFVKVAFVVGETQRLLVPATSLVERGEVTGVYVIDTAGRTSLRQIRLGHRIDDKVEVLAGLDAGERIATDPLAAMQRLASVTPGASP